MTNLNMKYGAACIILLLTCLSNHGACQTGEATLDRRDLIPAVKPNELPVINFWYGDEQKFGHLGNPQPLVNILGSITPKEHVGDYWYQLNNGKRTQFPLGPDLHRLAHAGDFNIEFEPNQLKKGENIFVIGVYDLWGRFASRELKFTYEGDVAWQLPYEVDFSQIEHLQDAVQVIDGKWTLTQDGVRTTEPYYDRQLAFGDDSWTDYELIADIVFHQHLPDVMTRKANSAPYISHAHTSFNLRWRGHPDDGYSPRRDWLNIGSLIALRSDLAAANRGAYWWMHFGRAIPGRKEKRGLVDQQNKMKIDLGVKYPYRMRVETIADRQARYSTKLWQVGSEEPADWHLQSVDKSEILDSGSIIFVVHHSDVTLCKIRVHSLVSD